MKRLLLAAAAMLTIAAPVMAASVTGHITFVSKRGQNPNAAETLIWLEPVSKSAKKPQPANFTMTTRGKQVVPHVIAVPAGSTVEFPNDDPISHNLFSLSAGNDFDLGLYRRGAGKSKKFTAPGIVNVYCNVHPNMSAVVHVMSSPYYAFADASGNYTIADVPAGKYRLVAWNEQGGQLDSPVEITAAGAVTGTTALTLDSRNYRESQHLNKNGKAYEAPRSRDY